MLNILYFKQYIKRVINIAFKCVANRIVKCVAKCVVKCVADGVGSTRPKYILLHV